jgi:hypothetical protein
MFPSSDPTNDVSSITLIFKIDNLYLIEERADYIGYTNPYPDRLLPVS